MQEPLRKIQIFCSIILLKEYNNLSEEGKDKFQRVQNAAKRMQTLIEDLLSYSRTNTGERKFEKTDLKKIIGEVKAELKDDLLQKHAVIETGELCEGYIVPFQFRQLMHNLLTNSLKFAQQGHAPYIKITSEIKKGESIGNGKLLSETMYCHICVSDNGIGFEPQYNEKIFELFQRLHGNAEYTGTGIGLGIVKKIVENHNGVITAKGVPGGGATFDIYLPLGLEEVKP